MDTKCKKSHSHALGIFEDVTLEFPMWDSFESLKNVSQFGA